ncbi:chain-length determining protein [Stutzerimonas kirkiae]|uniref:Chain-length determining protein n=1 Tax=Stutzerimonas kirkiae TaxID=2211392 RepID=A0A4Q9R165_9GAMM|nr:chain-length determining protein [Stutzerimonas kirkiae]TBV00646.1 chain-length determining protein [Stutzerimonas kirkiae]
MALNPNVPANQEQRTDEIDLFELFSGLWAQKWLIVGCSALALLVATAYAFLATPYYEVHSILRTTQLKELDELNGTGVYKIDPEEALRRVGASLDSYETRVSFFNANRELFEPLKKGSGSLENAFAAFNEEQFTLLQPDPRKTSLVPFVGLKLEYPADVDGVAILNGMVRQAISDEKVRIAQDLEGVIKSRLNVINRQLTAARAKYEASKENKIAGLKEGDEIKRAQLQDELKALRGELRLRRQSRITQLDEAIAIARSLGIVKPTTPTSMGQDAGAAQGNIIRTEVFNQQFPLYFMGSEALEAERNGLLKRRSDDHTEPRIAKIQHELQLLENNRQIQFMQSREDEDLFLAALADLREESSRLENIKLDLSQLQLARVDRPAIEPIKPIKPIKMTIMALGVVLGGMLGVFAALLRVILRRKANALA